jgi:hypothetical protein
VLPKNLPVKYAIVSPVHVPKMTVRRIRPFSSSGRSSSTALKPSPMYTIPSSVTAMRTVTPRLGPARSPSRAVNSTPAHRAPNTEKGL